MNQNDSNLSNINNNEQPINQSEIPINNEQTNNEVPLPTINQTVTEKKEPTLEDNIINIEIPTDSFKELETVVEPITNASSIPEVQVVEEKTEESKEETSVMVEKKKDNNTTDGKGALPVFIIFGLFIALLIGFPYISDYLSKLEEERKSLEFEEYKNQLTPSSTNTPTADTKNNFDELYNSCGTEEIFTTININYGLKENQCFKININNTKSFIKYIPAVAENDTKWSIYLGEKEIYNNETAVTNNINSIRILDNNIIQMQEADAVGNIINTYNYDVNGNLITSPNQDS